MTSTLPTGTGSSPDPASLQPAARPGAHGRFGRYGGQYVPETLMPALAELEQAAAQAWNDLGFKVELDISRTRPSHASRSGASTAHYRRADGGPRIWLKREYLNHTGAHDQQRPWAGVAVLRM